MKLVPLLFMLGFFVPVVKSQSPGGIKGAIHWYGPDTLHHLPALRSYTGDKTSVLTFENATVRTLNFHPSLLLSGLPAGKEGQRPMRVNLGSHDFNSASYFTVYQSLDTATESNIWHITAEQKTSLVLTTDRMADLDDYQYMNYTDVVRSQPKVNVYIQHKPDSVIHTSQSLNIGTRPSSPQLPISNFKGLVPELIVFDRVLNSTERLQVASYLSLKYGITLTEPAATYLNSSGDKIWDGYDYPEWHRNIAGICRDDRGGLYQTIAASSNTPGLLTISSKQQLINNSFLLWGDNDLPLSTASKIPGLPLLLQRSWLVKPYGNIQPFTTDLVLDTKHIDASLPVQPVYWLVIDPSGEGKFNAATAEFIKMNKLDVQGKVYFNDLAWDKDGSGKDAWSIIAGQDILLASTINQPTCSHPGSGSLDIKILGGQAPFQLTIQNTSGLSINKRIENSLSPVAITNLATGKYFLKIRDARQQLYTDSFYINNADLPLPVSLADQYILPSMRPLELNASKDMPSGMQWEWSGPSNFQSYNSTVSVTTPGLYTVRCSRNGCSNSQDVLVKALQNNILYDVTVFPNPSTSAFRARITLDKPAAVTMSIYSPEGKLVSIQKGEGRANYLFTGDIKASGVYELVFSSGLSKTTKRIVIAK
jgi:hypothetical protein